MDTWFSETESNIIRCRKENDTEGLDKITEQLVRKFSQANYNIVRFLEENEDFEKDKNLCLLYDNLYNEYEEVMRLFRVIKAYDRDYN